MTPRAPCGPGCLLLDGAVSPSSGGDNPPHGVTARDKIVVHPIVPQGGDATDPLFQPGSQTTPEERRSVLNALMEGSPPYVVPVLAVCSCSFSTPVLEGAPLQDPGPHHAGPVVPPATETIRWEPHALQLVLAQLAEGLAAMHRLGVAYGRPTIADAFWTFGPEGPSALWGNLNSLRAATEDVAARDTVGFLLACVWPALLDADQHSPSLFQDLVHVERDAGDVLERVAATLRVDRSDHVTGGGSSTLAAVLSQNPRPYSNDSMRRAGEVLGGLMGPVYLLEQLRQSKQAGFFQALLNAERARHRLLDEERTHVLNRRFETELARSQDAIRELRGWAEQLQAIVRYHEQREEAAEARAEALQSTADKAEELVAAAEAEAAELRVSLSASRAEAERLAAQIEGILKSRAWRLMKVIWATRRQGERLLRRFVRGRGAG